MDLTSMSCVASCFFPPPNILDSLSHQYTKIYLIHRKHCRVSHSVGYTLSDLATADNTHSCT